MNKTTLKYHIIIVSKYRKPILSEEIMQKCIDIISNKLHNMKIDVIAIKGDGKNHIHIMIESKPSQSVSMIVQVIKQMTSYYCWREFPTLLRKYYWYNNYFWSDGYFCCTTGDASSETVRKYIETQG